MCQSRSLVYTRPTDVPTTDSSNNEHFLQTWSASDPASPGRLVLGPFPCAQGPTPLLLPPCPCRSPKHPHRGPRLQCQAAVGARPQAWHSGQRSCCVPRPGTQGGWCWGRAARSPCGRQASQAQPGQSTGNSRRGPGRGAERGQGHGRLSGESQAPPAYDTCCPYLQSCCSAGKL